jgi:hypothetical protein
VKVHQSQKITVERLVLFQEDDSGDPDRERKETAWRRLFGDDPPKREDACRVVDSGDSAELWYRWFDAGGFETYYRVIGHSSEGGFVEVAIEWRSPVEHAAREFDFDAAKRARVL